MRSILTIRVYFCAKFMLLYSFVIDFPILRDVIEIGMLVPTSTARL